MSTQSASREDLYELVWIEPLTKLCKRFGISAVALGKACRRHQIPLPGRGHWAKVANGQAPPRPPLPAADVQGAVNFWPSTPEVVDDRAASPHEPDVADRLGQELLPENVVVVAPRVTSYHPAISALRKSFLQHGYSEASGLIRSGRRGELGLVVSKEQAERAFRILDAIAKAAEFRGFSWRFDTEKNARLLILDEPFTLRVVERSRQISHPTIEQLAAFERRFHYRPSKLLQPTGELRVYLCQEYWQAGVEDLKNRPLEERLGELFAAGLRRVTENRRRRSEQAREAFREGIRSRINFARRARYERLEKEAKRLVAYGEMKAFVREAQRKIDGGENLNPRAARFMRWASLFLRSREPVRRFLDEYGEEP
jgi:hypothetical protein